MPESAEVKITSDWLTTRLNGSEIRSVRVVGGRYLKEPLHGLEHLSVPRRVHGIRCRGKLMLVDLSGDLSMLSTLGMTGRWTQRPEKHSAIVVRHAQFGEDELETHYVDQRRFGTLRILRTSEANKKLDILGWDPLLEPGHHSKALQRFRLNAKICRIPICEELLDQEVFAGVGNYVRAEAMYSANIDPWKECKDISETEFRQLCQAIEDVCSQSYSHGGATLENFYDGDGRRGDHVDFLRVYGKQVDPHGRKVEKRKDKNGRTVWWCPDAIRDTVK